MFRLVGCVVLMLSTSAIAESGVIDLSKPQTDDFRSIIDLRGNTNLKPQDGNPVRQAETPAPPPQTVALANTGAEHIEHDEASAPVSAKDSPRNNGPRIGVVYLGLGNKGADANRQAVKGGAVAGSTKRSFRFGRRR
jgi:hypothetical protein